MVQTLENTESAFARYEEVRARLPRAVFAGSPHTARDLAEIADRYDGFLLDAFGVLNVGDTPIPGAIDRMAQLRDMGKRLCVLTNAASYTLAGAVEKYRRLGFDFTPDEVITSRDVAVTRLGAIAPGARWAAFAAPGDDFGDIAADVIDGLHTPDAFETADGFLFLSSAQWSVEYQAQLVRALLDRPRPVVVANPDLIAPREDRFSQEPGLLVC